ncbi:MAG: response regulator transcription factor [Bacteroidota bacterium]|mgnify:CR=1 FL=1
MSKANAHILIVEDDLNLGFLLLDFLEGEGYQIKLCQDANSAWEQFCKTHYDLCLLDVMLPDSDGFALARKIRQRDAQLPFLFLTARSMKEDKLRGYALGAEDFITKPFCEEELLCRIQVVLRRYPQAEAPPVGHEFHLGDYTFNYEQQELAYRGKPVRITQKENEVLRLLCLHRNRILRREEAVEQIYGKRDYFLGRSFDVFISRLRKLLKKDSRVSIENVFKVGFILKVAEEGE